MAAAAELAPMLLSNPQLISGVAKPATSAIKWILIIVGVIIAIIIIFFFILIITKKKKKSSSGKKGSHK